VRTLGGESELSNLDKKISELEQRVRRLEDQVFRTGKTARHAFSGSEIFEINLEDLRIPADTRSSLQSRIRKVSYWDLILLLLYFSPRPMKYVHLMQLSRELKKPISYDWLNTEFHRKKYSGLVRSDPIPGSGERAYSLNEPGRRRAESFVAKLTAETNRKV
jgi:hypothetical protein